MKSKEKIPEYVVERSFEQRASEPAAAWFALVGALTIGGFLAYVLFASQPPITGMLDDFLTARVSESFDTPPPSDNALVTSSTATSVMAVNSGRIVEDGRTVTIVEYDGFQFVPREVVLKSGEAVRFINTAPTGRAMRVGSRPENLSSTYYTSIVQPRAEGSGATFEVIMSRPGIWSYENLASRDGLQALGVVYVE